MYRAKKETGKPQSSATDPLGLSIHSSLEISTTNSCRITSKELGRVDKNRSIKLSSGDNSIWLPLQNKFSKVESSKDNYKFNFNTRGEKLDTTGNNQIDKFRGTEINFKRNRETITNKASQQDKISSQKRTKEISFGSEFNTIECCLPSLDMQVRRIGNSNQLNETRMVDVHFRPERGLFPCGNSSTLCALPRNLLGECVVPNVVDMI